MPKILSLSQTTRLSAVLIFTNSEILTVPSTSRFCVKRLVARQSTRRVNNVRIAVCFFQVTNFESQNTFRLMKMFVLAPGVSTLIVCVTTFFEYTKLKYHNLILVLLRAILRSLIDHKPLNFLSRQ